MERQSWSESTCGSRVIFQRREISCIPCVPEFRLSPSSLAGRLCRSYTQG
ncbi:hypothetical protein [Treponema zioleckii]|nr:hypothetical protein [Treponema zioleckii]